MTSVPARADVQIESTWNHESVFPSFEAWREEYQAVSAALADIEPFKDTLSESPARLAEWFDMRFVNRTARLDAVLLSGDVASLRWQSRRDQGHAWSSAGLGRAIHGSRPPLMTPSCWRWMRGALLAWVSEEDDLKPYQHAIDNLLRTKKARAFGRS